MANKTFRQEVEEILDGLCLQCPFEEAISVEFRNIATAHICAAAKRMAERMPRPNQACQCNACWAARKKLAECQAHIRKECQ